VTQTKWPPTNRGRFKPVVQYQDLKARAHFILGQRLPEESEKWGIGIGT
jgi:hypothetical protein